MKIHRFTLAVIAACALALQALAGPSQVGGRQSPDATEEIQVDLPGPEHMKNKSGTDQSGLCVFTSMEIAGHWQNVEELRGFQEKMTHEKGGGWPDKVDQMMAKYAPSVQYVQYSGTDPSIIKLALKTGRMCGVTYGYSPRYKSKISHMVDCVHMTDKWAAVLDNNFPGEDQYEWMAPDEFLSRWKDGSSGGWVIVLLSGNPPPPIPVNRNYTPVDPGPLMPSPSPKPCPGPGPCPKCSADQLAGSDCDCCRACLCGASCNCKKNQKPCCRRCDCAKLVEHPLSHCPVGIFPVTPLFPHLPRPHHPKPRPYFQSAIGNSQSTMDEDADWTLLMQLIFRLDIFRRHDAHDFGVDQKEMPKDAAEAPYYSYCGKRITALEAFDLVTKGGTLIDDTAKARLTIVGSPEQTAKVFSDLQTSPELLPFKDKLLVNAYPVSHWAITGVGMPHNTFVGNPWLQLIGGPGSPIDVAIVLQSAPDARGRGRVMHVQHDYNDGAAGLAKAIRKADPSYDPKKDPDLRVDDCPDCPHSPTPSPEATFGCPIYATLVSVIVLILRLLIPDIVYGVGWIASKAVTSIKSHAGQELAALKAELAALKQQKPAA